MRIETATPTTTAVQTRIEPFRQPQGAFLLDVAGCLGLVGAILALMSGGIDATVMGMVAAALFIGLGHAVNETARYLHGIQAHIYSLDMSVSRAANSPALKPQPDQPQPEWNPEA